MAAPTFVTEYRDASNIAIATSRTVSVTTAVGDVLVAWAVNSDAAHTINTPTGGTGLTWTLKTSNTGNASYCDAWVWTATATVSETFTFTITAGGTYRWVYGVQRWSGASGVGAASNTNVSSGAPSLGLTTTGANSGICLAIGDWNAGAITGRTWRTVNVIATETFAQQVTSAPTLTAYAGYHTDAGAAGAKTVGMSAPTGQKYTIVAAEILAQSAIAKSDSDTVTFGLTDTATITEKTKADSDTVTFALTDNGVAGIPIAKSGSDTVTFALTDNAAAPDKSTIKAGSDTVTFGLTDTAVRNTIGPTTGTWVSPTIGIPDGPLAGSTLSWTQTVPDQTSTLLVETSVDNGATWQAATNGGPIPRMALGVHTVKALLVRVTMSRAHVDDASPRLSWLEARVSVDSTSDELAPIGVFTLNETAITDGAGGIELELSGSDLSRKVSRNVWDKTYVIDAGTNYGAAIQAVIIDRLPGTVFNFVSTNLVTGRRFFGNQGSNDPWQDAMDMAESCGMELFFDPRGICTMRPEPDPDIDPAVWTFSDTANPTMIGLSRKVSDQDTYNYVIVTGESTDNTVPARGTAIDDDPSSPTYYLGPYGTVTYRVTTPLVASDDQAGTMAAALLLRKKGATETVEIDAVPMPALEPGDVVEVDRTPTKIAGRFILDQVSIPLGAADPMHMVCRRQRI